VKVAGCRAPRAKLVCAAALAIEIADVPRLRDL